MYADFGLTIDSALALAATGDEDPALQEIAAFLEHNGKDAAGKSVGDWTGIGTGTPVAARLARKHSWPR